jgi:hypothetical protein
MLGLASCAKGTPPAPTEPRYQSLPLPQVPNFMKETLFERVRFLDLQPMSVYGYSLVVNLHDTGDSRSPGFVRDYIVKQMLLRGFDSYVMGKYKNVSPDQMLRDKRVAIVTVEGHIPVGARVGQSFDVTVRALEHNNTRSLAHGDLYQTDLSDMGLVEPQSIGARQQAYAPGGPVFVNPAYALTEIAPAQVQGKSGELSSLRAGTVLDGGVSRIDRPISLQLRRPQASTARLVEQVISQRWEAPTQLGMVYGDGTDLVAKAENDALVLIYVPPQYKGDWKHFLGVVSHLYLNQSPEFLAKRSRELVEMAQKPGAPLADISLCWEAMGDPGLPTFENLISDPNPDVAFAAARAAAFLGDEAARRALLDMALDPQQHNQVDAVRVLAELPDSKEVDQMITQLLDSDRADVRIEAYRLLVANSGASEDSRIQSYNINHRFLLDIVQSSGPPMVYATSTGVPRIAIIGRQVSLRVPVTFTAMDMRLSITSANGTKLLTMFYRDPLAPNPEQSLTHNDLPEILARLGGKGSDDSQENFDLSFGDVVAVAEQLVAQHDVYGASMTENDSREAIFQLEHPSSGADDWNSLPSDNREGRPQGEGGLLTTSGG